MDTRLALLINAFENNGWSNSGSVEVQSDWWFEDIILLISQWRPIGTKLYLALLTDPYYVDEKIVWAYGVSTILPAKGVPYLDQLTLNDIKRTDLDKFVKKINGIVLNKK